ncbi:phage minor capsid protein [Rhodococcoides kyotonense]|uniref:Phage minor capsid protein 2 n=1 Tax=Rhodococcoides kyotonense TaxID=398843 RepID=A0A239E612_9NOCA|nr:phage minor capsid protein [Rhodococcus kyotonensis]SNS39881.1 Phage minor capsid protein 2 [Rhodococcus kyotonensis]
MALDPSDGRDIANGVAAVYETAELALLAKMADHLAVDVDREDWARRQQTEQLKFRNEARAMQRQLQDTGVQAMGHAVTGAAKLGRRSADEDLDDNAVAPRAGGPRHEDLPPSVAKRARFEMGEVADVTAKITTASDNLYVKVKMNVEARHNANPGGLRVDAVQQALDVLTARGITGFRDKAGRNWTLATYMEMKSRTVVNQQLIDSHTDRMKERGQTLLVVSSHRNPAPQCQPYEGQVLSLDGEEGTVTRKNAAGPGTVDVKIKATLEDARAQGFQHPNCTHAVSAFIPGASRTFTTEPDPEGYEATQRQRAMERAIRDTKRKQATAVTPAAKRAATEKLRAQQKAIKDHIEQHNLKRRPKRERIDLGYTIGDVDPDGILPPLPKPKPKPPTPKPAVTPKPKPAAKPRPEAKPEPAQRLSDQTRELISEAQTTMPKDRMGWLDTTLRYPRDSNGAKLVPEKLARHLDSTLAVGKAIRDDAFKVMANDVELVALRKDLATADYLTTSRLVKKIAVRESAIIRETLAEVRDFGGVQQSARLSSLDLAEPGTSDGIAALRRAETLFPSDWLRVTSANQLNVGSADRAFYHGTHDYIAAPSKDYLPGYRGAFDSYPDEVMAHELGHRMEKMIPGLTHLEYALVRSRSTKNGTLEPLTQIYPNQPGLEGEVGYADQWENIYAGKSYAKDSQSDPAKEAAEAFQVGLQDTFGRSSLGGEFDKSNQLQEFVIGVMALL